VPIRPHRPTHPTRPTHAPPQENGILYGAAGAAGVVGLIVLIVVERGLHIKDLVALGMGLSNTFALFVGLLLMGYGLVEIPRELWKSRPEQLLKWCAHRCVAAAAGLGGRRWLNVLRRQRGCGADAGGGPLHPAAAPSAATGCRPQDGPLCWRGAAHDGGAGGGRDHHLRQPAPDAAARPAAAVHGGHRGARRGGQPRQAQPGGGWED
jgi:hypothetical protein